MVYSKQTWVDGANGGTPLSAARFNHMEDGIAAADAAAASASQSGGGSSIVLDGLPADSVTMSSTLPSAEDLGAAPISVVDVLPLKADLVNGKVPASQLPASSTGGTASKLLIVRGVSEALPDGYSARRDFSEGTTVVGTGTTFASPPHVSVEPVSAADITVTRYASATGIETTGFWLNIRRSNTTLMSAAWIAIGVSP